MTFYWEEGKKKQTDTREDLHVRFFPPLAEVLNHYTTAIIIPL